MSSFVTMSRSSMPLATGKPPLPKSPTELLQLSASAQRTAAITTEPGHGAAARNRLTQLGLPEGEEHVADQKYL